MTAISVSRRFPSVSDSSNFCLSSAPKSTEAATPLDKDVHAPVVELLEDLDNGGRAPDLADPVLLGEDDPELVPAVAAFVDEQLVALLEDVQGDDLAGKQHEPQREQADDRRVVVGHARLRGLP